MRTTNDAAAAKCNSTTFPPPASRSEAAHGCDQRGLMAQRGHPAQEERGLPGRGGERQPAGQQQRQRGAQRGAALYITYIVSSAPFCTGWHAADVAAASTVAGCAVRRCAEV